MIRILKCISQNGLGAEDAKIAGNMSFKNLAKNVYRIRSDQTALSIMKRRLIMSKVHLTMELPKVGDKLKRIVSATSYGVGGTYEPKECVVTYVNKLHHWYEVTFIGSGVKECFGVPVIDHSVALNYKSGNIPVICVENGVAYSSIEQCSIDTKIPACAISRQISGNPSYDAKLHFVKIV